MIGNILAHWLRQRCECCPGSCDCGCVLDCPRPEHRAIAAEYEAARIAGGDA